MASPINPAVLAAAAQGLRPAGTPAANPAPGAGGITSPAAIQALSGLQRTARPGPGANRSRSGWAVANRPNFGSMIQGAAAARPAPARVAPPVAAVAPGGPKGAVGSGPINSVAPAGFEARFAPVASRLSANMAGSGRR